MTIRSINELLAQADATIEDNTSANITPADVRSLIKDFLDTVAPAYAAITCSGATLTLSATPQAIAPFTSQDALTTGLWTVNLTTGSTTRALSGVAGSTTFVSVNGTVEGPLNDLVTVRLYKNGAPTPFLVSATCQGAGRPVGFDFSGLDYTNANATFDVRASGDAGSKTFSNVFLLCQTQTVRSFT